MPCGINNIRGEGGNVVSTSGRLSCPYIKYNKSGTTKTTNGRIKQPDIDGEPRLPDLVLLQTKYDISRII